DLVRGCRKPLCELGFHVRGGDNHLDLALQPTVERFSYLHLTTFVFINAGGAATKPSSLLETPGRDWPDADEWKRSFTIFIAGTRFSQITAPCPGNPGHPSLCHRNVALV